MTRSAALKPAVWTTLASAAGLALLGVVAHATPPLALINESPSIPRGLYVRVMDQDARAGSIVAVQPAPEARTYLTRLGMPAGTPLLKRVVASAGTRVCRQDNALQWPGRTVRALAYDRRGAVLPTWSGCRRLGRDELLVMGDTPTSFDSRYFGPVRSAQLGGVYVEALRW